MNVLNSLLSLEKPIVMAGETMGSNKARLPCTRDICVTLEMLAESAVDVELCEVGSGMCTKS